jgi:nitroreductase
MELSHAMRTTPAAREYTDDDVPDDVLFEILDDARFAPNGGNRQQWHVIVVRDPTLRAELARLYREGFKEYMAYSAAGMVPFNAHEAYRRFPPDGPNDWGIDVEAARAQTLPDDFQAHMAKAPVLLVITVDLARVSAVDAGIGRLSIAGGASVYPFAHNILLGARQRGFGGHFTTVLSRHEAEAKALLHIPETHALATMLPIGKPPKEVTKLSRDPVESFTTVGTFNGPTFARP